MRSNSFELESKKLLEFMHERKQIESSVLILLVKKKTEKKEGTSSEKLCFTVIDAEYANEI